MKIKPFKMPRSIKLPGVTIPVRVVDREEHDGDGDRLGMGDGDWGYNPITGQCRIRIARDLPLPHQRATLIHELIHALHDYEGVAQKYNLRSFPVDSRPYWKQYWKKMQAKRKRGAR